MRMTMTITCVAAIALLTGCATSDPNADFIAEMDSLPQEKQLPNWATTKALMMRNPPKVGDMAPDFSLKARDGDTTTKLSQFRNDRPVVLIFGSWT